VTFEEVIIQSERILRLGLTVLVTYLAAVWIATIWWTFRDIRARSADVWLQIAATLLVAVLNFPGLLIYFILRPPRTLAEAYAESLEEEAWQRAVAEGRLCPACHQSIEPSYLFCPWCQARLRWPCPRCERPISLRWKLCPYCGTAPAVPGPAPTPAADPPVRT
jgi:hypothetical protein